MGTSCVNTQTDSLNCGACGKGCNGGTCAAGLCQCPPGQSLCSGVCRAVQSDTANCGVCGRTCTSDQACISGACTCGPGTSLCNGHCISTVKDNLNCGGCGNACPASSWCSGSACVPAFTCQTNFTAAPSDCPAFPLSAAACGQESLVSTTPWTANNTGAAITVGIAHNPAEELRVVGSCYSTQGTLFFHGPTGGIVASGNAGCCCGACVGAIDVRTTGSAWSCSSPADISNLSSGGSFSFDIEHWAFNGKYNSGGTSTGSPVDFAKDATSGRVCDQVCGDLKNVCGDSAEYYRLVLPAGKGVDLDSTFATRGGSTTFDVNAIDMAGALICPLVFAGQATGTPGEFKARLVNNTDVDQQVMVVPSTRNNSLVWNMVVGVEP